MKFRESYDVPVIVDFARNSRPVIEMTPEYDHWEFFPDQSGQWRWITTNQDGITTGSSPRGFNSPEECIQSAINKGYERGGRTFCLPELNVKRPVIIRRSGQFSR